jgi:hypothetical protein
MTIGARKLAASVAVLGFLAGCITTHQQDLGLVPDPGTGLAYGSATRGSVVTDAAFFENNRIKIKIRNTSGDVAFDLHEFRRRLEESYRAKGYEPTSADDFGLILDVNVVYSGMIQDDLREEFGFLGATWGGSYGAVKGSMSGLPSGRDAGAATGMATGAAIGSILGSFVRENTYIMVTRLTFGVRKKEGATRRKITFSRSLKIERDPERNYDGFRKAFDFDVAVYGGAGINVAQSQVTGEVRRRIVRIVGDAL